MKIVDYKLVSKIDPQTNEIVMQDEYTRQSKNLKAKGYNLVYLQELMECVLAFKSCKQWYIVLDLLKNEMDVNFNLNVDYKKIARTYNISEKTSQRILSTMIGIGMIRGNRGTYKCNPFIVLPSKANDEVITRNQARWSINA